MWLGVRNDAVFVIEVDTLKPLKKFAYSDWKFFHLPNGLLIGKTYTRATRFTTKSSYYLFELINRHIGIDYGPHSGNFMRATTSMYDALGNPEK